MKKALAIVVALFFAFLIWLVWDVESLKLLNDIPPQ